jgi:hypothetical protein
MSRPLLPAVAFVALALGAAACDGGGGASGAQEAVGIVTSVEGSSPAQVNRFTLRTADGAVLTFEIGRLEAGGDSFPASHLREHLATAEPVRVAYRSEGGSLVAVRLRDGP